MIRRYAPFLFWLTGAVIISASFYAATAMLWRATREAAAASLEKSVVSSSMREIAEGNLLKFFSTLTKLQRDGQIQFAEIRHLGRDESVLFKTPGDAGPKESSLRGLGCRLRPTFYTPASGGMGLITILPTKNDPGECDALALAADMPEDLRRLKDRLSSMLTFLVVTILLFFSFSTFTWHKHVLKLEIQNSRLMDERDAAIGRIAAQVAHDIRSPLAALEVVAAGVSQLPDDKLIILRSAVKRIQDIAEGLIDRHRSDSGHGSPPSEAPSSSRLSSLIISVVEEKRLELSSRAGVKIELQIEEPLSGLFATVTASDFKRMISNLINNSVEAFGAEGGTVSVSLRAGDGEALLRVGDSGKGIPAEMLSNLGRRGATHGKPGGSGLGLFHAFSSVESWGGRVRVESKAGEGTTVTARLPLSPEPAAGIERLDAVLIDDDALARATWKMTAARLDKRFRAFASADEFFKAAGTIDRRTPIYVDADLGESVRGEAESRRICELGFDKVYLATGHEPAKFAGLSHLSGVIGKAPPWT